MAKKDDSATVQPTPPDEKTATKSAPATPTEETKAEAAPSGSKGENAVAAAAPTAEDKRNQRLMKVREGTDEANAMVAELATVGESTMAPFNPHDFNACFKLAGILSESGVVSDDLKGNAGAVMSVMACGAQLGLHWSVAVQQAYVVHGRVGWPAAIIAALVDTSPAFEYFEILHADNETCTVEAKKNRWDKPRQHTVTMQDAQMAGFLDGKHSAQWKLRPYYMLIAMARREAGRMWDPGRLAGIYDVDELRKMHGVNDALPPARATASLERFGSSPAALTGAVDVSPQTPTQASSAQPDAKGQPAEPKDDRARFSLDQLNRIRKLCDQIPKIEEAELQTSLDSSLDDLRGAKGEAADALYTRVLTKIKALKQAAAK